MLSRRVKIRQERIVSQFEILFGGYECGRGREFKSRHPDQYQSRSRVI